MMKKNDVHALVHALCTLCTLCARSVHALVHGSAFILKYSIECTMIACLNIRWTLLAMKWLKVMLYNETKAHNALCTLCARCARCARSCALIKPWITLCIGDFCDFFPLLILSLFPVVLDILECI